tara:strand:+ start:1564 stop:2112 length:549 start_codon:yes stop_codon:yes gene_type:complete
MFIENDALSYRASILQKRKPVPEYLSSRNLNSSQGLRGKLPPRLEQLSEIDKMEIMSSIFITISNHLGFTQLTNFVNKESYSKFTAENIPISDENELLQNLPLLGCESSELQSGNSAVKLYIQENKDQWLLLFYKRTEDDFELTLLLMYNSEQPNILDYWTEKGKQHMRNILAKNNLLEKRP